ncbi:MAG: hypothetical protein GY786_22250 [Proteobacteria bacterium]|nr:hypothetical protein [Pseudomonadota bacterium]
MISSFGRKKRAKRLSKDYKPTHEELQKAMDLYIQKGGIVTILHPEETVPNFMNDRTAVDDFLMG